MNENRLNPRFLCDETATIVFNQTRLEVLVVDVSYGGMGIQVPIEEWEPFEFAMELKGEISLDGAMACFNARVCWTSSNDEFINAGLEIKDLPKDTWRQWVDQQKGIQPPEKPMFDVG